ncbi:hypothetical protein C8R43DRAFT_994161 [Mycena crocata]|nr:hypothetical protein C8R43DRAFT_994161 [Mycena crocata]
MLATQTLRHRLRYNIVPTDAERDIFLQSTADGAEESAGRSEYFSLFSPIRRLPEDLLESIFLHPVLHDHLSTSQRPGVVQSGTSDIATVCYHWRSVALESPRFWASIDTWLTGRMSLSPLRLWIGRSKDAALSLKLHAQRDLPINAEVARELLQQAHRWRHVHIFSSADRHGVELLSMLSGTVPSLESISFAQLDVAPVARITALSESPNLRVLRFNMLHTAQNLPALPHNQIRHLSESIWSGSQFRELLMLFPNVDTLEISIVSASWEPEPTLKPHFAVRNLVLHGRDSPVHCLVEVLNMLNLPHLERLEFLACSVWHAPSVASFQQRSACQLTTCILRQTRLPPSDLLHLLNTFPTLETLVMDARFPKSFPDSLLKATTYAGQPPF